MECIIVFFFGNASSFFQNYFVFIRILRFSKTYILKKFFERQKNGGFFEKKAAAIFRFLGSYLTNTGFSMPSIYTTPPPALRLTVPSEALNFTGFPR